MDVAWTRILGRASFHLQVSFHLKVFNFGTRSELSVFILSDVQNTVPDNLLTFSFVVWIYQVSRCRPFERAARLERAALLFAELSHVRSWINITCREDGATLCSHVACATTGHVFKPSQVKRSVIFSWKMLVFLGMEIQQKHIFINDVKVHTDKLKYVSRAEQSTKINRKRRMTTEEIQANASTFLIAGFETTGTTLAFSAYLLAKHPEIQDKTRDEVRSIIEKENGLTYDGVFSMRLLDQVISEVLRLYPPVVGFITRRCENDYEYEGLKIPKDITVVVPAYQLHHDPVYWENPEEFDPERFSPENKDKIEPMAYQPFGNGPRNCVAMRFGQLTLKMTLAKLLSKYKFTLDEERHKNGLKIGSSFTLAYPEGGVWIYINGL
ncbi:hypothetical protein HPB47_017093 [Ixodes persulcatus]|uniref:Uncharacterized protein n=1 Tax=Ixodes persulcatus TaxID=34615 RepID=A0AC60QP73_IXOPE|nr:hypothetical protein HPB47_017093 [Ixodes persulcatus]